MGEYMKYETFLRHIRKPLPAHQRKIVFHDSNQVPETLKKSDHLLNRYAFTLLYHKYKTNAK